MRRLLSVQDVQRLPKTPDEGRIKKSQFEKKDACKRVKGFGKVLSEDEGEEEEFEV